MRTMIGISILIALSGCPGSLDPTQFAIASCPDVVQTLFTPRCASAGCHSASAASSQLDLESPGMARRLLAQPAHGGGGLLLDPYAPDKSVLYTKLTSVPPFGARMPLGQALDAVTVECVLEWVKSAAANTDGGAIGP